MAAAAASADAAPPQEATWRDTMLTALNDEELEVDEKIKRVTDACSTETELHIDDDGLTPHGAVCVTEVISGMLAHNTSLTELTFSGIGIGANCAGGIKANATLTLLAFGRCIMEPGTIAAIGDALKGHPSIENLVFSNTDIGPDGAEVMGAVIEHCPKLVRISLGFCEIEDAGALAIAASMKTNATLMGLTILEDTVAHAAADSIADAIKDNATLRVVELGCNLGDEGVKSITHMIKTSTSMRHLVMEAYDAGDDAMIAFADAIKHSTLSFVDIDQAPISDKAASALADGIKGNTSIRELRFEVGGTGDGFTELGSAIAESRTMDSLGVYSKNDYAPREEEEEDNDAAADIHDRYTIMQLAPMFRELKKSNSLRKLRVAGFEISPDEAGMLMEAIHTDSPIRTLSVIGPYVSKGIVDSISVPLNDGCPLTSMSILGIMDDDAMVAIAAMIEANSTLKKLHLNTGKPGEKASSAIVDALKVNETLLVFDLDLDGAVMAEVDALLARNKVLARPGMRTKRARTS